MAGESKPVISCCHHPIDRDPSLKELADLPLGWWAERDKPGEPWIRHQRVSAPRSIGPERTAGRVNI
jgi:hypothetical protein